MISLRPATADDARFLAHIGLLSSRSHRERGVFDLAITESEGERLAFMENLLLAPARSFHHYETHTIAEFNGRPAAALSGYSPADPGRNDGILATWQAAQAVGWDAPRFVALVQDIQQRQAGILRPPVVPWVIDNAATLPEFRRQGLMRVLIGSVLDQGRQRGHAKAQVSVFVGNDAAQRAYEAAGFRFLDEQKDAAFEAALGVPGIRRFIIDLKVG